MFLVKSYRGGSATAASAKNDHGKLPKRPLIGWLKCRGAGGRSATGDRAACSAYGTALESAAKLHMSGAIHAALRHDFL
jgi:hypothetical protein